MVKVLSKIDHTSRAAENVLYQYKNSESFKALLLSMVDSLNEVEDQIELFQLQLTIWNATGKLLDYWGEFLNVPDRPENDNDYRSLIFAYLNMYYSEGSAQNVRDALISAFFATTGYVWDSSDGNFAAQLYNPTRSIDNALLSSVLDNATAVGVGCDGVNIIPGKERFLAFDGLTYPTVTPGDYEYWAAFDYSSLESPYLDQPEARVFGSITDNAGDLTFQARIRCPSDGFSLEIGNYGVVKYRDRTNTQITYGYNAVTHATADGWTESTFGARTATLESSTTAAYPVVDTSGITSIRDYVYVTEDISGTSIELVFEDSSQASSFRSSLGACNYLQLNFNGTLLTFDRIQDGTHNFTIVDYSDYSTLKIPVFDSSMQPVAFTYLCSESHEYTGSECINFLKTNPALFTSTFVEDNQTIPVKKYSNGASMRYTYGNEFLSYFAVGFSRFNYGATDERDFFFYNPWGLMKTDYDFSSIDSAPVIPGRYAFIDTESNITGADAGSYTHLVGRPDAVSGELVIDQVDWGTELSNLVEIPQAKKDYGYQVTGVLGDYPNMDYENTWRRSACDWIKYGEAERINEDALIAAVTSRVDNLLARDIIHIAVGTNTFFFNPRVDSGVSTTLVSGKEIRQEEFNTLYAKISDSEYIGSESVTQTGGGPSFDEYYTPPDNLYKLFPEGSIKQMNIVKQRYGRDFDITMKTKLSGYLGDSSDGSYAVLPNTLDFYRRQSSTNMGEYVYLNTLDFSNYEDDLGESTATRPPLLRPVTWARVSNDIYFASMVSPYNREDQGVVPPNLLKVYKYAATSGITTTLYDGNYPAGFGSIYFSAVTKEVPSSYSGNTFSFIYLMSDSQAKEDLGEVSAYVFAINVFTQESVFKKLFTCTPGDSANSPDTDINFPVFNYIQGLRLVPKDNSLDSNFTLFISNDGYSDVPGDSNAYSGFCAFNYTVDWNSAEKIIYTKQLNYLPKALFPGITNGPTVSDYYIDPNNNGYLGLGWFQQDQDSSQAASFMKISSGMDWTSGYSFISIPTHPQWRDGNNLIGVSSISAADNTDNPIMYVSMYYTKGSVAENSPIGFTIQNNTQLKTFYTEDFGVPAESPERLNSSLSVNFEGPYMSINPSIPVNTSIFTNYDVVYKKFYSLKGGMTTDVVIQGPDVTVPAGVYSNYRVRENTAFSNPQLLDLGLKLAIQRNSEAYVDVTENPTTLGSVEGGDTLNVRLQGRLTAFSGSYYQPLFEIYRFGGSTTYPLAEGLPDLSEIDGVTVYDALRIIYEEAPSAQLKMFGGGLEDSNFIQYVENVSGGDPSYLEENVNLTANTAYTVTHSLGQQLVIVDTYTSTGIKHDCEIILVDSNSLTVTSSSNATVSIFVKA